MHRVIYTSFVFCVRFFSLPFFAASMLSLSLVYKCARFSFVDSHSANNKSNLIPLNLLEAIKSYMQSIFSSFFGIGTSLLSFSLHFVLVFCCTNISIDSVYIVWTEWMCEFFYGFFVSLIAWYCIFIAYRSLFHLHCRWHWFLIHKMSVADLWMEAVTPWVNCVKLSQPNTIA